MIYPIKNILEFWWTNYLYYRSFSPRLTHPPTSQNTSWRPTCKGGWLTGSGWIEKMERKKMIPPKVIFLSPWPPLPTYMYPHSLFFFSILFSISCSLIHAAWSLFAHNSRRCLFWKDNNWHHCFMEGKERWVQLWEKIDPHIFLSLCTNSK